MEQLFKIAKIIHSDSETWQLSMGIALGFALGLLPLYTFSSLVLLLIVCVFKINIGAFLLSFGCFSGLAWMLDQQLLAVGEAILLSEQLQSVWQVSYQHQLMRLAHFNHTLVMGAWAFISVLTIPLFLLCQWLIARYRDQFLIWIQKTKLMRMIKASKWYERGIKAYSMVDEVSSIGDMKS